MNRDRTPAAKQAEVPLQPAHLAIGPNARSHSNWRGSIGFRQFCIRGSSVALSVLGLLCLSSGIVRALFTSDAAKACAVFLVSEIMAEQGDHVFGGFFPRGRLLRDSTIGMEMHYALGSQHLRRDRRVLFGMNLR